MDIVKEMAYVTNVAWFLLPAAAIIGYLLGSINGSLIVGKFYGVDVREHGSGNAGATNTLRTLGKKAAVLVILVDILKAVLAIFSVLFLSAFLYYKHYADMQIIFAYDDPIEKAIQDFSDLSLLLAGMGCILGHNWPAFFRFRGGKGVLSTAAVIFTLDWRIGVALLIVFALVVAVTRYVSLGSIAGAAVFPIISVLFGMGLYFTVFSVLAALLVIFRHSSNIRRLIAGTESKLSFEK